MYYFPKIILSSVAKLFQQGTVIRKEDVINRIDQSQEVPDNVKRFWHQLQFNDVYVDGYGRLNIDSFNDADMSMS